MAHVATPFHKLNSVCWEHRVPVLFLTDVKYKTAFHFETDLDHSIVNSLTVNTFHFVIKLLFSVFFSVIQKILNQK